MSLETARKVLEIEGKAILALIERLDELFVEAVDLLAACRGRVVFTGMGKSGIICRKISATMSSTGTPSLFLHPSEAIHGDLGQIVEGDILVAISYSGETAEIVRLLELIKRIGVPLIAITGKPHSTLAEYSDVLLNVGIVQEACPMNLVPTASTATCLAYGDALAIALLERKGFGEKDFARYHPGGSIGQRLQLVGDLMHTGERMPRVTPETAMSDVIIEMSNKGFGLTCVAEERGTLLGVITDGDLRRSLAAYPNMLDRPAKDCMTINPLTIEPEELATTALRLMEENKITALVITDEENRVRGLIHLHDLWRTEMI